MASPSSPLMQASEGAQMGSIDAIRADARQRFKERLERGEPIGGCSCHEDRPHEDPGADIAAGHARVTGVRFVDSGQMYFFDAQSLQVDSGAWVVVETSRGQEAAKVVLAPHQVELSQLEGPLRPIQRLMSEGDIARMRELRRSSAVAVRLFADAIRRHQLPMKPISAEYSFDGSAVILSFSAPDRVDFRTLARDLAAELQCRVELRQVGPRDEARLLGGLGRCGRTLCCSSWLPMFPEVSMGMAKTQELSLNPGKVSGVCGRLLCCLSYENEQYRQMKAIMPKLGQRVETPRGPGMVVALQILKNQVTVRLEEERADIAFDAQSLGFGGEPPMAATPPRGAELSKPQEGQDDAREQQMKQETVETDAGTATDQPPRSGRRRRRRRGKGSSGPAATT